MSTVPLVSVIVPNFNYNRSLGECLRALKAQTYRPIEIIVVDDASTDDSLRTAREAGVTVLSTAVNSGVAVARNLGAAHAAGDILIFVDSDVAVLPDAVAQAVDLLESDPGIGAACGVYEDTPMFTDSLVEECRCLQACYWRMSSLGSVSFLFTAICAMRAEVFAEIGPFNPRLRQTEEVDYGQRLSQRYKIELSPDIRGRHDDDDHLLALLHKLYRRARLRVPLYVRRRRFARGFETANRSLASLAALAAIPAVALMLVIGPVGAVVPVALLASSVLLDAGTYVYALRRKGFRFALAFAAVAFTENVAITAGVLTGVAQWLISPAFRALYERPNEPVPALSPDAVPLSGMLPSLEGQR